MITLLYFSAPWCGPCKAFGPIVEKATADFKENQNFKYSKVDVDLDPESAAKWDVTSIPTLIYLKGDRPAFRSVGQRSQAEVKEKIESLLKSTTA